MKYLSTKGKEDYLYGCCNVFAVASKHFLKGQIVCLLENRYITSGTVPGVYESLIHCFLKISDTLGFDAKGVRLITEILDDYQFNCTEFPSWLSDNKTDQEVLEFGYSGQGGHVVIDVAIARQYIQDNLIEEIESVPDSSRNFNP